MGKVELALDEAAMPRRGWHALAKERGKSENVSGEIELIVQYRYNPSLDFSPFKNEDATPGKEPNELRVGLSQGRGLVSPKRRGLSKSLVGIPDGV